LKQSIFNVENNKKFDRFKIRNIVLFVNKMGELFGAIVIEKEIV